MNGTSCAHCRTTLITTTLVAWYVFLYYLKLALFELAIIIVCVGRYVFQYFATKGS
jgi:hypothetical protein